MDREKKCHYLKIHDCNSLELLFLAEVYYNFGESYKKLNDYFYYFELEKGFIGFSFHQTDQASLMFRLI